MRSLVRRLLALFRRARLERDLEDELTFHLAMREAERRIDGDPAAAARLGTRKQFGSALLVKEQAREAWAFRWLEGVASSIPGMLVGFALFGILLAGAGVYALVAYETSRRTHELGIRMALGATPSDVVRVVIGRSMALSGAGAATGLVVAYALGRMMKSMVYGVSPYEAVSFTGALGFLLATALIAAFVPALRATRVDPLVALRHD